MDVVPDYLDTQVENELANQQKLIELINAQIRLYDAKKRAYNHNEHLVLLNQLYASFVKLKENNYFIFNFKENEVCHCIQHFNS